MDWQAKLTELRIISTQARWAEIEAKNAFDAGVVTESTWRKAKSDAELAWYAYGQMARAYAELPESEVSA